MVSKRFARSLTERPAVWILTLLLLCQPLLQASSAAARPATGRKANAPVAGLKTQFQENYGKLPLHFEANRGQTDPRVRFFARGPGYSFFLLPDEAVMRLQKADRGSRIADRGSPQMPSSTFNPRSSTLDFRSSVLRMKLAGANRQPRLSGMDELPGKSHYFLGADPRQWKTDAPTYGKVKYEGVYPGIDLVYYGNQQQLEYDFIVAPGADPKQIKLSFSGAERMRVDESGDLILETKAGDVRQHKPFTYQEVEGVKQEVASRYVIIEGGQVGFEVDAYDASKSLVIDPILSYSTFVTGDSGEGVAENIAVDAAGNAYVTGWTGIGFPTTAGAVGVTPIAPPANENWDGLNYVFIAKLSSDGSRLIYSAIVGGTRAVPYRTDRGPRFSLENRGADIAIDAAGNAYVVGTTFSRNFPTTPGAIASAYNADLGSNEYGPKGAGFALKLSATGGELLYSTLLLEALPRGVAVDAGGHAYVTGSGSQGFPTTPGAFQPNQRRDTGIIFPASDAILAKLNPTGAGLSFSTFIGGGSADIGWDIALDAAGNAYITGYTAKSTINDLVTSPFPETRAAFENFEGPNYVYVFAAKFSATGALGYSVLLGGAAILDYSDYGPDIAVDTAGNAYVAGFTRSAKFPVTPGAYQTAFRSSVERDNGFVTKLNATGTELIYSTLFGGSNRTQIYDIGVNAAGQAQIAGKNLSAGFPTASDPKECFFIGELNSTGSQILSYTPFPLESYSVNIPRSIAVDAGGSVYVAGNADLSLITTPGAYRRTFNANHLSHSAPFVLKLAKPRPILNVSAASYNGAALAGDSIISAFGSGLATTTQAAMSNPLPTTLAGTTVKVKDSAGVEREAPLFFVSPTQINYLLPAGTANGAATITVNSGDGVVSNANVQIENVAPGLFTADASGRGAAAAVVLRVKADGSQSYEPVVRYDTSQNKLVAVPIDLGAESDQVFLIVYGTGMRYRSGMSGVSARLGGTNIQVLFTGAQGGFAGLDQINLRLPRELAGRGEVDVTLTVDGKAANAVKVSIN